MTERIILGIDIALAPEAKGAKQIGAGMGGGQADIDIELDGCRFNVSIRPLIQPTKMVGPKDDQNR